MANELKVVAIWDGIINYEEGLPDDRTETVKGAIDAGLKAFEQHKDTLLTILRNEYERDPKSEPFNPERSWRRLIFLAGGHFWQRIVRQEIVPAADRRARLAKFAKFLKQARYLVDGALRDEVGADLCAAWWEGTTEYAEGEFVNIEREFERAIAGLAALETAALRAAEDMPRNQRGPIPYLSRSFIRALADAFRENTGREPGRGEGPFARFVMQTRAALDPTYKTTDENGDERVDLSLIDAIKDALKPRTSKAPHSKTFD